MPRPWSLVATMNPILYMVEGMRYGLLGVSSWSPWTALLCTAPVCVVTLGIVWWMLATGYKLRG